MWDLEGLLFVCLVVVVLLVLFYLLFMLGSVVVDGG